ncbi:MAG: hypothetical protein JSR59_14980 [Proteobacteria bacterium]|nr:hypothetical protein [Pseudomonadota bacterium]
MVYEQLTGAKLRERVTNVEVSQADVCFVAAINGHKVSNSFDATVAASRDMGRVLRIQTVEQTLAVEPQKLMIACKTVHAAPIGALFGRSNSVEGEIDFSPKSQGRYVVTGTLSNSGSAVWIEDAATAEIVSAKVSTGKP